MLAMRHAPVGHRAVLVEQRRLAERPLGLVVPEAVKLPDALLDELLGLGRFGRHREVDLRHPRHQVRLLPRPFVEDLAVIRMPRQRPGWCRRSRFRRLVLSRLFFRLGFRWLGFRRLLFRLGFRRLGLFRLGLWRGGFGGFCNLLSRQGSKSANEQEEREQSSDKTTSHRRLPGGQVGRDVSNRQFYATLPFYATDCGSQLGPRPV